MAKLDSSLVNPLLALLEDYGTAGGITTKQATALSNLLAQVDVENESELEGELPRRGKNACEACGVVVGEGYYSAEDCNSTGRGVVLCVECCENVTGAQLVAEAEAEAAADAKRVRLGVTLRRARRDLDDAADNYAQAFHAHVTASNAKLLADMSASPGETVEQRAERTGEIPPGFYDVYPPAD